MRFYADICAKYDVIQDEVLTNVFIEETQENADARDRFSKSWRDAVLEKHREALFGQDKFRSVEVSCPPRLLPDEWEDRPDLKAGDIHRASCFVGVAGFCTSQGPVSALDAKSVLLNELMVDGLVGVVGFLGIQGVPGFLLGTMQ